MNPNEEQGLRAANEFFDFDFDTGEIKPAEQIDDVEWSMARRTIDDIDLNDELSGVEAYDPDHLFNQRRYSLYLFIEQITSDPGLGLSDYVGRHVTGQTLLIVHLSVP